MSTIGMFQEDCNSLDRQIKISVDPMLYWSSE
jgi:hypothetical protein